MRSAGRCRGRLGIPTQPAAAAARTAGAPGNCRQLSTHCQTGDAQKLTRLAFQRSPQLDVSAVASWRCWVGCFVL
eukprot:324686-Chlamydomonas_euryale.AAC.2